MISSHTPSPSRSHQRVHRKSKATKPSENSSNSLITGYFSTQRPLSNFHPAVLGKLSGWIDRNAAAPSRLRTVNRVDPFLGNSARGREVTSHLRFFGDHTRV